MLLIRIVNIYLAIVFNFRMNINYIISSNRSMNSININSIINIKNSNRSNIINTNINSIASTIIANINNKAIT